MTRTAYLLRSVRRLFMAGLCVVSICGATSHGQECAKLEAGSHSFRRAGEIFEIPITVEGCQGLALEVGWANGRNNGTNLHVTFVDSARQTIYTKEISAFVNGHIDFPFLSMPEERWVRSGSVMMTVTSVSSVPQSVLIQAVAPFALPAGISYRVTRTQVARLKRSEGASKELISVEVEGKSRALTS